MADEVAIHVGWRFDKDPTQDDVQGIRVLDRGGTDGTFPEVARHRLALFKPPLQVHVCEDGKVGVIPREP